MIIESEVKTIITTRGGQPFPIELEEKGDKYDSISVVYKNGIEISRNEFVNTDPSMRYKNNCAILNEGEWAWILGDMLSFKKYNLDTRALFFFKREYWDKVLTTDDLTTEMQTLPSLIPNPYYDDKYFIVCTRQHIGGSIAWDYSRGCVSNYGPNHSAFMDMFSKNEKGLYILKRQTGWESPGELYHIAQNRV